MSPINEHPHHGRAYWRTLSEKANDPKFAELLEQEFEAYDPDDVLGLSRRSFVKIMGASMALAGLTMTGCRRWPEEKIMPFAVRPSNRTPNTREAYASMLTRGGVAQALLVAAYEGRPIKVDGNPEHPIARGASDALTQASILELYDPARSRFVEHDEKRSTWADFEAFAGGDHAGLAFLSEANDSPALAAVKKAILKKNPGAKWYTWEALHRDNETAGIRAAFGKTLRPQYHLDKADIVVTLDADLLGAHPGMLQHARDWANRRRSADEHHGMNRLYAIESSLSTTGSVADKRLPIASRQIAAIAQALLNPSDVATLEDGVRTFVEKLLKDLVAHPGKSLVIAGANQPAEVHELAWRINDAMDAIGKTVTFIEEPDYELPCTQQIAELTSAIKGGQVKTLVILGGNPVYDAPAELKFGEAFAQVENRAHLSLQANETTAACNWRLPRAHDLEAWGDGLSWDGTHCIRQPIIRPLFEDAARTTGGRSEIEVAALFGGEKHPDGEKLVRAAVTSDDAAWRKHIQLGFVEGSAAQAVNASVQGSQGKALTVDASGYELTFVADASVYDGRHAINGWLQETPDPLTKLTWDNAALINIADARDLGIGQGDIIEIAAGNTSIQIAAYLMPGQASKSIALPLGYGRKVAGHVGTQVGFDVYPLRTTAQQAIATGATITNTKRQYKLATTSDHYLIDWVGDRSIRQRVGEPNGSGTIIKEATLEHYQDDPYFAHRGKHGDVRLQMYEAPMKFNEPHAWGMTIDMASCIGCNACVVSCQSENNIPIVGKDQVLVSREMAWLRIDRYFKTDQKLDPDAENPQVVHMPMMCQHCENAPCEQVCPVAATVHDSEGLNTMVYNRCIGTRYCSNNCPYKVRRFNYFDFHAKNPRGMAKPWLNIPDTESGGNIDKVKRMVFNPDVTVRMRGVMEKCTYCVQRIAKAKTDARVEQVRNGEHDHRTLEDGAVVTACQQACPTQAIVFGDLNNPESKVAKMQRNNRAYEVLDDLNTRPRTKYLAQLRNPGKA